MRYAKCSYPKRNIAKVNVPAFFNHLDDLFGTKSLFDTPTSSKTKVNIIENQNSYAIEVLIPGFSKEDFSVKLDKDLLTISGEYKVEDKEEGKERKYVRREFSYTSFKRSFHLPESVDSEGIIAKYDKGILNITIPKKAVEEVEPARDITIS